MNAKRARVFWTGRSQAVRLPKEFRFVGDAVLVRRKGNALILEPAHEWPAEWLQSFSGIPEDFARPDPGRPEKREQIG